MLTAADNQLRVCLLSIKYNVMREMLNKTTFLTNIGFMILNNATFILQWIILFRLKEDIGNYTMKEVMLLWGLAASSFGLARILFARAFSLPDLIINGKLDSYLVQPKNVLLSVITSDTNTSAIGDFLRAACPCDLLLQPETSFAVPFVYGDRRPHPDSFCRASWQLVLLVCAGGCFRRQYA